MKKLVSMLLALCLVLGVTAASAAVPAEEIKVGYICIGDENEGYSANHINGLKAAQEALGISDDQVMIKYNIPETEAAYEAAVDLAENGCDIIFATSFGQESYVFQAAAEYPDIQFCHATGTAASTSELTNVHNYFTAIYEARYVSGVVAGMKLNQMIEDGTITASWQTASGAPAGGWYVTYGVPTSNHEPRLQECTENSVTLKGLIPDADYTISLTPADGADVFGTVEASARTPSGGRFDRYGATPSTTYISLWETPAEVNWDYRSLTTSKTSFSADEDIALCLELTRKEDSDDEITLLYVIRNANGEPVSDASAQLTWDQMWHERRHTSTIPNPGAAGEYTLEVYVNRQLLKSIDFAIS